MTATLLFLLAGNSFFNFNLQIFLAALL